MPIKLPGEIKKMLEIGESEDESPQITEGYIQKIVQKARSTDTNDKLLWHEFNTYLEYELNNFAKKAQNCSEEIAAFVSAEEGIDIANNLYKQFEHLDLDFITMAQDILCVYCNHFDQEKDRKLFEIVKKKLNIVKDLIVKLKNDIVKILTGTA